MTVISRYCKCSAGFALASTPGNDPDAEYLITAFASHHSGPGHEPCTAEEARGGVQVDERVGVERA